jgi:hypothetical protein
VESPVSLVAEQTARASHPLGRFFAFVLEHRSLALVFLFGVFIRFALLPIAVHQDFYAIYSRSAEVLYDGNWTVWGSQFLIQAVHTLWLFLMTPLLPGVREIWSDTAAVLGVGFHPDEYAAFLEYEYLPRLLFLLKLPYLLADLIVALLLVLLVDRSQRVWAAGIWLLNPLVIYTSVLFARHESISIALVLAAILAATRGRRFLGLNLLGVGAVARFFPALLAPFFVLAYRRSRREVVWLVAALLGLWAILEFTVYQLTGTSPVLTLVTRYPQIEDLVALAVPLYEFPAGISLWMALFPVAYAMLLFWYVDRLDRPAPDIVIVSAGVFSLLFALTFFNTHYVTWLVPFIAIGIARYPHLIWLHFVQLALLSVHVLQWGPGMTTDLVMPMGVRMQDALPDPHGIFTAFIPPDLLYGVARSLFAAVTLWLAYRLIRLSIDDDRLVVRR